ncbi:MAG: GGDEF domain-containing protein [Armatimonadota bacterium]|nr:GGDEF domain-containing protein [bacterium]
MKTVRDLMTPDVVWVTPSTRVKVAITFMKGHSIGALPVLVNSGLVGIVTLYDLLGEPQDAPVEELMTRRFTSVDPDMTAYDAARLLQETGDNHLLVTQDDQLVGILSQGDLMPELGRTFDPLTELPWSDSFREWSMNALKRGLEITIILFDLDKFGIFNKKYGHVVGDTVIKEVAGVLKRGVDPDLELLCRYGGDEFGLVTVRRADEAAALAEVLKERVSQIKIDEVPEGVSMTYGMFGGRRTKEREDMHYAATIDDLITRASKNCTANKPNRIEEALPALASAASLLEAASSDGSARAPRLKIETISFISSGTEAKVGVTLARGGNEFMRESSGYAVGEESILRLFAEAAAGAVCKSLAPDHGIVVEDASLQESGKDDEIVTVVAMYVHPRSSVRLTGSALVRRGDHYRAAAAALLDAVNRQVELAPSRE